MRAHDERTLHRNDVTASFVFFREMVRADFDCRSRLRRFYGLLTVLVLAARVILICIASLHYSRKDRAFGASSICETRVLDYDEALAIWLSASLPFFSLLLTTK